MLNAGREAVVTHVVYASRQHDHVLTAPCEGTERLDPGQTEDAPLLIRSTASTS